jgi:GAF domain-containing protein
MNMEVITLLATAGTSQEELVDRVARIACADVADSCAVAVLSSDERVLHPLGLYDCRDELMSELEAQPELAWAPVGGNSEQVLRTGEAMLITSADWDVLARGRPLARTLLERMDLGSAIVAAMRAAGTKLGVVIVGRIRERRPFAEDDLPYIQALADKVALGLVNIRLSERVSGQLQPSAGARDDALEGLTDREREILRQIGEGLTNREIGKLGLSRRSELIAAGRRL